MKKTRKRLSAALLVAAGALTVLPGAAASADSGDGQFACNSGEICLYDYTADVNDNTNHFWWNATYSSSDQWFDGSGYYGAVRDDVSQVRNRDSSCNVKLINVVFGPDGSWTAPNDGFYRNVSSGMDQKADKHERVC
jgi:ABC-type sugar transport system substrate-binding protein